jgi:hypothetical protein
MARCIPDTTRKVERTSTLEADAQAVTKKGAVAGKHGGEHRCVVVRKPEEPGNSRRGGLIGEADEAFAGGLLDGMEATGRDWAGICHNDGYIVSMGAAERGNPLLSEPGRCVPDTGVEEPLFGVHRDGAVKSFTTDKRRKERLRRSVQSEAETLRRGKALAIDGGEAEVDLLAALVADDVGVGREGVDEVDGGSAHDVAIDDVGGLDTKVAY